MSRLEPAKQAGSPKSKQSSKIETTKTVEARGAHKPKLRLYANLKTKLEPELYLGHENFGNRRLFTC